MCAPKLPFTLSFSSKVCETDSGAVGSQYLDTHDASWKCFLVINALTALPLCSYRYAHFPTLPMSFYICFQYLLALAACPTVERSFFSLEAFLIPGIWFLAFYICLPNFWKCCAKVFHSNGNCMFCIPIFLVSILTSHLGWEEKGKFPINFSGIWPLTVSFQCYM